MIIDCKKFSLGFEEFLRTSNVSQQKIAEACGVSSSVVSGWKSGRSLPTYESLQALYNLGMSANLMFGNVGGRDVELWSLFGLDGCPELSEEKDGLVLSRWDRVLRDPDKTTAQKAYFFFVQANTFREVLEDLKSKTFHVNPILTEVKKNND